MDDTKITLIWIFIIALAMLLFNLRTEFCKQIKICSNQDHKTNIPGTKEDNEKLLTTFTLVTIFSRLSIYIIGYMSLMISENKAPNFWESMYTIWNKWDAKIYLRIAEHWYPGTGDSKYDLVFYPFYPILIRLLNYPINDYFFSGILVSNICLIVSCFYLYKLTKIDFNSKVAFNSVKYLLIYPFSFFLATTYSDSLFLALAVMSFYYMRTKNWLLCGMFGLLASFTRFYGIILLIPAGISFLTSDSFLKCFVYRRRKNIINACKHTFFISFIFYGFFLYLLVNKLTSGEWFKFFTLLKENWSITPTIFTNSIVGLINNAKGWEPRASICLWIPELVSITLVIVLIFYSFNKVHVSYTAYMLAYLFAITTHSFMLSGSRYIMGIIPIYILLGLLSRNKVVDFVLSFIMVILLGYYSVAFTRGLYVM